MLKSTAIELLGGTTTAAAEAIGVSYQAIDKWPMVLPRRIEDRVLAAQARKYLSAELLGLGVDPKEPCSSGQAEGGLSNVSDSIASRHVAARKGAHA